MFIEHPIRLVLAADPRQFGQTLADFLIRLRCLACRARAASAVLIDGVSGQAAARAEYSAQAG